jgi:hypothetical protein
VPDIWVDRAKVTKLKSSPWRIKEKDLPGHLSNGNDKSESSDSETETEELADVDASDSKSSKTETSNDEPSKVKPSKSNMELASTDYQLNEALALLKGLNILARRSK